MGEQLAIMDKHTLLKIRNRIPFLIVITLTISIDVDPIKHSVCELLGTRFLRLASIDGTDGLM